MIAFRAPTPRVTASALALALGATLLPAAAADNDRLAREFHDPPASARPRTWWHWTMSNVTTDGITKDLAWMARVGIAGFQLADVNFGRGQEVEARILFGTLEWYDAARHAADEAARLGLEMGIFSSPGWSETGGPWVQPHQAMKKLVWSELHLAGPERFEGRLPAPPSNNGPIRNVAAGGRGAENDPTYYADSAVIAFPTPQGENTSTDDATPAEAVTPVITTNTGPVDAAALLDDDLNSTVTIPAPSAGGPAWVQFTYAEPFTARAFTIGGAGTSARGIPIGRLLAGDAEDNLRPVLALPGAQLYRQGMVRTFALPPTTARVFRLELTGAPLGPAETMNQAPARPAEEYVLSEAILHAGARVHRWEEKAGFSFLFEYQTVPTPDVPTPLAVDPTRIIDLTSQLRPDGTLAWDVPAGDWTVVRLGYSLTGAKNRPATPAGSGFEADKLSREHMTAYYHGYFDPLRAALGEHFGTTLRYVMMDSWEAGTNNWTDAMRDEFVRRRGYDPTPFLPVLTGRVVGSADASDRFLWDFRRTLADMWADHHYGTMADLLRADGIGIYAEAAGVSLEMPEDTLLNKSKVEIPMGEFWVRDLHPRLMYLQDVRGAASAAHAYGKRIVAAEAFTGGGYESPATLMRVASYWFAQGVNRIVFHTSAHQPLDTKPGNTMVGTHLHRNITWAEQARPFIDALARTSHLLQQGHFVADLAYLLDEGAPSTPPIWAAGTRPVPPEGYDYDFINADVLLNRMSVAPDGRLVLPDGMSYRVLVLPETDAMRPELVRKIGELVRGGAVIVGPRPVRSPSLMRYPEADDEVRTLALDIWGDLDGASRTIRRCGAGTVIWGWPLDRIMALQGIPPDFAWSRPLDAEVAWLHRRAGDTDIYYVANLGDTALAFNARFRVSGKAAELWRPVDGSIAPASYTIADDATTVPLRLEAHEALFVVFRQPTSVLTRTVPLPRREVVATVDGPWHVQFPPQLGAPPSIELPQLIDWTNHPDEGVRYFSGTATYSTTLQVPDAWFADGARLGLDLGEVHDLATVIVNGTELGISWMPPHRIDATAALRPGANEIVIRVTNQWTNRLIGDRLVPEERRVLNSPVMIGAFGAPRGRSETPPPPPSGLLGPVTIYRKLP